MSAARMLVQLDVAELAQLVRQAVRDELGARPADVVFMRLAEVAKLLNCSEKSVLRRIRQGLPAEKLGAEWRFEQAKVLEYMRGKAKG